MRAEERLRSHICNLENELEDLRTSLLQGNKLPKGCHKSVQTENLVALVDATTQASPQEVFFLGDSISPANCTSLSHYLIGIPIDAIPASACSQEDSEHDTSPTLPPIPEHICDFDANIGGRDDGKAVVSKVKVPFLILRPQ
jgi:hypothetical protein